MKDNGFTLITCSYNTPLVTECMLKSYFKYHPGFHRLILVENSDDDATQKMLDKNNVPYVKGSDVLEKPNDAGWAWSHHVGLDWAVNNCTTTNCLIVDTDILFIRDIFHYFDAFVNNPETFVAAGVHMDDYKPPGKDYVVKERIHPSFMMLNADFFRDNNLTFGPKGDKHYDIGSHIFEQIKKSNKKTIPIRPDKKPFIHAEGLSWAKEDNKEKLDIYNGVVYNDLKNINITDNFVTEINYEYQTTN